MHEFALITHTIVEGSQLRNVAQFMPLRRVHHLIILSESARCIQKFANDAAKVAANVVSATRIGVPE